MDGGGDSRIDGRRGEGWSGGGEGGIGRKGEREKQRDKRRDAMNKFI